MIGSRRRRTGRMEVDFIVQRTVKLSPHESTAFDHCFKIEGNSYEIEMRLDFAYGCDMADVDNLIQTLQDFKRDLLRQRRLAAEAQKCVDRTASEAAE